MILNHSLFRQQMSLVAYHQLENETLLAELSNTTDCVVHIIDQITCHKVSGIFEVEDCSNKFFESRFTENFGVIFITLF